MAKVSMYCLKCRRKVAITNPAIVTLKRGRSKVRMRAYKAVCPICGTPVYRIIGKA